MCPQPCACPAEVSVPQTPSGESFNTELWTFYSYLYPISKCLHILPETHEYQKGPPFPSMK